MNTRLEILDSRKIIRDTIARGGHLVEACGDGAIVLGVLSKMPPSVRGFVPRSGRGGLRRSTEMNALTNNHFTSPAGPWFGGQATLRFGHVAPAPYAHASALGARRAPQARAGAAQGLYGPQLTRTRASRDRGRGFPGGRERGAGSSGAFVR